MASFVISIASFNCILFILWLQNLSEIHLVQCPLKDELNRVTEQRDQGSTLYLMLWYESIQGFLFILLIVRAFTLSLGLNLIILWPYISKTIGVYQLPRSAICCAIKIQAHKHTTILPPIKFTPQFPDKKNLLSSWSLVFFKQYFYFLQSDHCTSTI